MSISKLAVSCQDFLLLLGWHPPPKADTHTVNTRWHRWSFWNIYAVGLICAFCMLSLKGAHLSTHTGAHTNIVGSNEKGKKEGKKAREDQAKAFVLILLFSFAFSLPSVFSSSFFQSAFHLFDRWATFVAIERDLEVCVITGSRMGTASGRGGGGYCKDTWKRRWNVTLLTLGSVDGRRAGGAAKWKRGHSERQEVNPPRCCASVGRGYQADPLAQWTPCPPSFLSVVLLK